MTTARDEKNKALLASFLKEVWSDGDIEGCTAYLAETYIIHHDPGDPREGQSLDARLSKLVSSFPAHRFRTSNSRSKKFRVQEMIADTG